MQPHRSSAGRCCRHFDSDTQTWCGSVTVMVLVSTAVVSGPRVRDCIRACRYRKSPLTPILRLWTGSCSRAQTIPNTASYFTHHKSHYMHCA